MSPRPRSRAFATCTSPLSATLLSAGAWWTLHEASGATASLDIERADCPEDAAVLLDAIKGFDLIFCNAESRAFVDAALERPLAGLVAAVVTTLGADGAQVETARGAYRLARLHAKDRRHHRRRRLFRRGLPSCAPCRKAELEGRPSLRQLRRGHLHDRARRTVGLPTADQVLAYLRALPAGT